MLALCGFEAARLFLGQEENLHKKISVVFRILVLTVPAQVILIGQDLSRDLNTGL